MSNVAELVGTLDPSVTAGRRALLRRVVDFVAIPAAGYTSRLERAIAGDILLGMLVEAEVEDKILCARRLAGATDAPRRLLRYLGHCAFEIAQPVLEHNTALDCSDLKEIIEHSGPQHLLAIAHRRNLSVSVTQALVTTGDIPAITALLENQSCTFSEAAMDSLVRISNTSPELCPLIANRQELVPSQSLAMFWWCDAATRLRILKNQTGERTGVINSIADMFKQMTPQMRADDTIRKSLKLIDRRQRNREAIAASTYGSLEKLIEESAKTGLNAERVQEIAYICDVKSVVMAKLLTDSSGEGIAVICKAVGLKKRDFQLLWRALRRPVKNAEGVIHPEYRRVYDLYLMLSVSKAQTALRYWNWSLGASFLPSVEVI